MVQHGQPVHLWHGQIKDDQICYAVLQVVQRLPTIVRCYDLMTDLAQLEEENFLGDQIVVYNEDCCHKSEAPSQIMCYGQQGDVDSSGMSWPILKSCVSELPIH
jgi:hypothetical protein